MDMYSKTLTQLGNDYNYKYGFTLKSINVEPFVGDLPADDCLIIEIIYYTKDKNNNYVKVDNDYKSSHEAKFIIKDYVYNGNYHLKHLEKNIVDGIKFLIRDYYSSIPAILENVPTSLYQNPSIIKELIDALPDDEDIYKKVKPIIIEKHKAITHFEYTNESENEKEEDAKADLLATYSELFDCSDIINPD